jgi:acyl-CoA synthetase (AMP-forming)/AMP-acid ligase II
MMAHAEAFVAERFAPRGYNMFGDNGLAGRSASQTDAATHARETTFCDILRLRAAEMPNKQAFVFLNSKGAVAEEFSFAALDRRAQVIAIELIAKQLSGKRVLLMFPPGLDFVAALFACFYAGAVAVPLPYLSGKRIVERISSICRDADPTGLLTLASLRNDAEPSEIFSIIPHGLVWIEIDNIDQKSEGAILPAPIPETLALLQYTSGSTHSPKGVMLTHANLIANNRMIADAFGHDQSTRGVSWLPLFHDMGLIGHVLQPIYFGGLSVLMSPLSFLQRPCRWLEAISTWKATTSGGPTHAFELCLKSISDEQMQTLDLKSWRLAYCGSEKVRADVLEQFATRFASCGFHRRALRPCFGLAEATLMVSIASGGTGLKTKTDTNPSGRVQPTVSCGHAAHGSSVVVVDPGTKVKLADGIVGEIWVRGPHVAQGYWRASTAANDSFRATLADGSGTYLRTGDLGFIDDSELFLVGRIKDTIIINGLKHSAEDIEASAGRGRELFAGFAGAAFGIDTGGQEKAVLIQEIGRSRGGPDEIGKAVADAFACVTHEHGLRLIDLVVVRAGSLPRTSSGKIRRSRAREIYLANGFLRLNPRHFVFRESALSPINSDLAHE